MAVVGLGALDYKNVGGAIQSNCSRSASAEYAAHVRVAFNRTTVEAAAHNNLNVKTPWDVRRRRRRRPPSQI
jgi:hypothetical protein